MNNNATKYHASVLTLAFAGILLGIAPLTASSDDQIQGVFRPDSIVLGRTYGDWSASWWQYIFAIPAPANPTLDPTGQFCNTKPSGVVSYLAGYGVGGPVTRTCTLPSSKPIFFPISNVECSTLELPQSGFHCDNEQECRACAGNYADNIKAAKLNATIDGQTVGALRTFRVQSPFFSFSAPENNIFGKGSPAPDNPPMPGGTGFSVSDGYWLMLKPLPAGNHVIFFTDGGFQNVTYYLTVTQ